MRNRAVLADAPPIELNEHREAFSEKFKTKELYERLKIEVKKILKERKDELLSLEISPEPEYAVSNGNFKGNENYEDSKSYYIKINRFNNKRFAVIRVSEHLNQKNPKPYPINTVFFDIDGKSEEEVEQSFNTCLKDLNSKIDSEHHKQMIREIAELSNNNNEI